MWHREAHESSLYTLLFTIIKSQTEHSLITVLLATYNGQSTLRLTLESFTKLTPPMCGWKLIVVNNRSTDATQEILEHFQSKLPLTILQQPTPGKNIALNTAIPYLEKGLIINTDDDIIAPSNWLVQFEAGAARHPSVSIFAGQVRHYWQKKPAQWLVKLAENGSSYAGTPTTKKEEEIQAKAVKGPNFMVRSDIYLSFIYPINIGPDGTNSYSKGSETSFLLKIANANYKFMYIPDACVQHIVRPHQVGITPVLKRYYSIGKGSYQLGEIKFDKSAATLFGLPRYTCRLLISDFAKASLLFTKGDSFKAMQKLIGVTTMLGAAIEMRKSRQN